MTKGRWRLKSRNWVAVKTRKTEIGDDQKEHKGSQRAVKTDKTTSTKQIPDRGRLYRGKEEKDPTRKIIIIT